MSRAADGLLSRQVAEIIQGRHQVYSPFDSIVASAEAADTFGTWIEIVAADTIAVPFVLVGAYTVRTLGGVTGNHFLQLGYGGAGSEVLLVQLQHFYDGVTAELADTVYKEHFFFAGASGAPIPANSRIAARLSGSGAGPGSPTTMDGALYYVQVSV